MSNPYQSQSISGYDGSPPSDDGATTLSNKVSWATIKTKLADPINTFCAAVNSAVSTAFGTIFLNSTSSITSTYTIASTDRGKLLSLNGSVNFTVTLPTAISVGDGWQVSLKNIATTIVTITPNGSDTIDGVNSSITLSAKNDAITLMSNGSTSWSIITKTGDVLGPSSSTDGNIPKFSGTTGKVLADAAIAVTDLARLSQTQTFTKAQTITTDNSSATPSIITSPSTSGALVKATNTGNGTTVTKHFGAQGNDFVIVDSAFGATIFTVKDNGAIAGKGLTAPAAAGAVNFTDVQVNGNTLGTGSATTIDPGHVALAKGLFFTFGTTGNVAGGSSAGVLFETPYSSNCLGVICFPTTGGGGTQAADYVNTKSTTGFTIHNQGTVIRNYFYIAIGI